MQIINLLTVRDLASKFFKVENKVVTLNQTKIAKELTYTALANTGSLQNNPGRRNLIFDPISSLGKIHIDFYYRGTSNAQSQAVATLPSDSPVPEALIETQTFDGGTIWINPNARTVVCSGLTNGQRYIVDLLGFFRV